MKATRPATVCEDASPERFNGSLAPSRVMKPAHVALALTPARETRRDARACPPVTLFFFRFLVRGRACALIFVSSTHATRGFFAVGRLVASAPARSTRLVPTAGQDNAPSLLARAAAARRHHTLETASDLAHAPEPRACGGVRMNTPPFTTRLCKMGSWDPSPSGAFSSRDPPISAIARERGRDRTAHLRIGTT